MNTVLITGGSGFLGRRAAAYLGGLGFSLQMPTHRELDITDTSAVRSWFRENRPEAVIHTAAVSDTGLCRHRPRWSEAINVGGCIHLAEACRESGSRLILCSSDQVYSGSRFPGPHREEEVLSPDNVYANQKLRAERHCLELLPDTVCLRLSWMYARESLPGEHGHFLSVLKTALENADKPLSWPVYDRRGITDVEAVVKNLPAALKLPGGVYNFGSENNASTYETVREVFTQLGMNAAVERLMPNTEAFAAAPRDISMDPSRRKAFGIRFPTTAEGLASALRQEGFL